MREKDESGVAESYERIISPLSGLGGGSEENYLAVRALDGEPNFSLPVMGTCAPRIVIQRDVPRRARLENNNLPAMETNPFLRTEIFNRTVGIFVDIVTSKRRVNEGRVKCPTSTKRLTRRVFVQLESRPLKRELHLVER